MDSKELRIGNLVTINNKKSHLKMLGVAVRLTGISELAVRSEHFPTSNYSIRLEQLKQEDIFQETFSQFDEFVEPIALNEEWLTKFGFEYSENDLGSCLLKQPLEVQIPNVYYSHSWDDYFTLISTKIKYVHQLQNLYFALTGEELVLKDKDSI